MSNRFVIILIACVAAFAGIFWFTKNKASAPENGGNTSNVQPTNHVQGAGNKKVTLVEYGDFQCPACFQYEPIVREVIKKYGDDITFQFRHFPLSQIHQNAFAAHRAAEAAAKQGKFWEMHDALYDQQKSWESVSSPVTVFEGYAKQLKLNLEQFKKDAASAQVNAIINADITEAGKVGADSTPTFVINGKKIETNPRDVAGFSKLIDEAIANAKN